MQLGELPDTDRGLIEHAVHTRRTRRVRGYLRDEEQAIGHGRNVIHAAATLFDAAPTLRPSNDDHALFNCSGLRDLRRARPSITVRNRTSARASGSAPGYANGCAGNGNTSERPVRASDW